MPGSGSRWRASRPAALHSISPGGPVPRVQAVLVVGVVAPGRQPREVERGRPEAADVAHLRQQPRARPRPAPRARRRRSRSPSPPSPWRGRRAASGAAARRRAARGSPARTVKSSSRSGSRIDADVALAGHRHAPLRDAEEVVDGAVERVDDPAQPGRCPGTSSPSSPRIASSGRARGEHARGSRARPRGRPRRRGRSGVDFGLDLAHAALVVARSSTAADARAAATATSSRSSALTAAAGGRPTAAPARSGRRARAASPRRPGGRRAATASGRPSASKPAGHGAPRAGRWR